MSVPVLTNAGDFINKSSAAHTTLHVYLHTT